MHIDSYGIMSLSAEEIFDLLYEGKLENLKNIYSDQKSTEKFNLAKNINKDSFDNLSTYQEPLVDIKTFDSNNQKNWFLPEEYQNLNIEKWLLSQCNSIKETNRVEEELELFRQYKMANVLKFLKYLVDTMRSNKIVWGVGRGSSVASYCLYLIGVHKINSIQYNLDIKEFLK